MTACFLQVLHLEGDVFVKAKLMYGVFTGGVIYPVNSIRRTPTSCMCIALGFSEPQSVSLFPLF